MKILILKTSALGDIIHCFPTFELLRSRYPDAKIDWVVEKAGSELLRSRPGIDHVFEVDTRRWRRGLLSRVVWREIFEFRRQVRGECYDWLFDLQGNLKSSLLGMMAQAKRRVGYGWRAAPEWMHPFFVNQRVNPPPGQNIRDDYLHIVRSALDDWGPTPKPAAQFGTSGIELDGLPRPLVLVCPGAAWMNKRLLPDVLANWLKGLEQGYFLLLWGNTTELAVADTLHQALPGRSQILPRLGLPALQALMTEVDHVIAMDSLPLHLAGSCGTPTWSVFGPSSPNKYRPLGDQHQSLQGDCPYGQRFDKRCPKLRTCGTGACIRGLKPEQLLQAFGRLPS